MRLAVPFLAALLGTAAPIVPAAAGSAGQAEEAERLDELLDRSRSGAYPDADLQLATLAREVPELLVERLHEQPLKLDPETGVPLPGRRTLDPARRKRVLAALESAGRERVLPVVGLESAAARSPGRARVALLVVGRVGGADELLPLFDLVERIPAYERPSDLASKLEDAAAAILSREPQAAPLLRERIATLDPGFAITAVRALRGLPPEPAGRALSQLLEQSSSLDRVLLIELERRGPELARRADTLLLARAGKFLWSDDPEIVAAAARALGALEDYDAATEILAILDGGGPTAAEGARIGLEKLCGRPIGNAPSARTWIDEERAWFDARYPELRADLALPHAPSVIAALHELASHRWRRHELAGTAMAELGHPDRGVRSATCVTLAKLGSRSAVEPLVDTLADPDPAVRDAAWKALRALTGRDLPADPEAWRDVVEP